MPKRAKRSGLVVVTITTLVMGIFVVSLHFASRPSILETGPTQHVQAGQPASHENDDTLSPKVVVGTPEAYTLIATPERYTYRNEFPDDLGRFRPLYLIDTQTGQETRLGDDSGAAIFGTMNDETLLWYFHGDLQAYDLGTGENRLVIPRVTQAIYPQIGGNWVAAGRFNGDGSKRATLYAANLQTHEMITLTQALDARDASVSGFFGISPRLAAWKNINYGTPNHITIYDLDRHTIVTELTNITEAFSLQNVVVYDLTPGETVVTWSGIYGYDLVTESYFDTSAFKPPNWVQPPTLKLGRIMEQNRTLSYLLYLKDGSQVEIRAPLLDATPSTEPCIADQNLVQNGDLETIADHALWQQRDTSSDLIVDELPPGLTDGGAWAIRLGRYADSHATIRQRIEIPSGVSELTVAFEVRALSWDFWGGDRLQVDLIDPLTGNSRLAMPVQWTNVELASDDWLPMQVAIEKWPGINTPVELVFQVRTDWALPTDFIIDNIQLTTTCVTE